MILAAINNGVITGLKVKSYFEAVTSQGSIFFLQVVTQTNLVIVEMGLQKRAALNSCNFCRVAKF